MSNMISGGFTATYLTLAQSQNVPLLLLVLVQQIYPGQISAPHLAAEYRLAQEPSRPAAV